MKYICVALVRGEVKTRDIVLRDVEADGRVVERRIPTQDISFPDIPGVITQVKAVNPQNPSEQIWQAEGDHPYPLLDFLTHPAVQHLTLAEADAISLQWTGSPIREALMLGAGPLLEPR